MWPTNDNHPSLPARASTLSLLLHYQLLNTQISLTVFLWTISVEDKEGLKLSSLQRYISLKPLELLCCFMIYVYAYILETTSQQFVCTLFIDMYFWWKILSIAAEILHNGLWTPISTLVSAFDLVCSSFFLQILPYFKLQTPWPNHIQDILYLSWY